MFALNQKKDLLKDLVRVKVKNGTEMLLVVVVVKVDRLRERRVNGEMRRVLTYLKIYLNTTFFLNYY